MSFYNLKGQRVRILIVVSVLLINALTVAYFVPSGRPQSDELIPDFTSVPYDFFNLSPATTNPVLTAADVTDRNAQYIADCHMLHDNDGVWYMFFEVCSTVGIDIGVATSNDGLHWTYRQVVLDEPFTLAYPEVFKWNGEYYMVPETYEINQIRLYKATNFPYTWTFVGTIMSGHQFVDPSIFRYNSKWWLFAPTIDPSYNVYLYYSDNLADPASWHEHPSSPVVIGDASEARGGGRTTIFGGNRIIRLTQKCDVSYGEAVRAFEVDTLTDTSFAEHEISQSPIVRASGSGWNKDGMHTTDPWWTGDRWLACADGVSNGIWSVGMYVSPQITEAPAVSNPSPPDGSADVSLSLSQLSFSLTDFQGNLMNYVVSTQPDIGSGSGTSVANGQYSVVISGLSYATTYKWFVNVTDGTHWTNVTYTFTTSVPTPSMVPDWSNVLYDPFSLNPAPGITNPVLKPSDVTDRSVSLVFAPDLFYENNLWYMFMCVYGASGDIGLATSNDGHHWTYRQVVLDEPFCVSCPEVFKYGDTYYMLTEEWERNEVRLYRATSFPYAWTYVNSLVSGRFLISPTILRYSGTWWMFVGGGSDICYLYYSDSLTDPASWHEHPLSPIVSGDASKGRPGGEAIVFAGNRVIRFAMKNNVQFGEAVRAFEVDTLTKTGYAEHEVPESPIIGASGSGWNGDGMHWVDPWWTGDRWLAAVDGVSGGTYSIGIYETTPATRLYVDPSLVQKTPQDVGDYFTVSVKVESVTDLYGFDVKITWDNTLITFSSLDSSPLNTVWPQGFFEPLNPSPPPGWQTGPGFVRYAAVPQDGNGFTGSGTLFTITFHIEKASNFPLTTAIHFDTVTLSDSHYTAITATLTDGTYTMGAAGPDLEFALVEPNPSKPFEYCKTFEVEVCATHVTDMTDFDLTVLFSSELFKFMQIDYWGDGWTGTATPTPSTTGSVRVTGAGPSHTGEKILLFALTFHVEFDQSDSHIWRTNNQGPLSAQISLDATTGDLSFGEGNKYINSGDVTLPSPLSHTISLIRGDVDCNGKVDTFDLRTVAAYYDQAVPPGPAKYDLKSDGTIDIFDLVIIGSNFGYPPP